MPPISSSSLHLLLPPLLHSNSTHNIHFPHPPGIWRGWAKDKGPGNLDIRPRCRATSKYRIQEYATVFQNGLPVIKWPQQIVEDEIDGAADDFGIQVKQRVDAVKSMLVSMDDGEITISSYDTAWVALVKDINGGDGPQFPSSVQWIVENQLPDGSWGDSEIFSAHDRLINTLACVVALKSWNIHPDKCNKGLKFFKENISKLEKENEEHMPIGFEVAFPSLLEVARGLNIDVPYDSPIFQNIYAKKNLKLTKIPKEILHNVPTTLLHSLEGMVGLDWEKLLKLQCQDGSFLFSPSSTAFALMETKDANCLSYLNNTVQKFNGGVPNVYPVDMFEHIWAVDRLERLGISRYFKEEIKDCVEYVYRYWTEQGICWARNTRVHDIDDTAMGFRILRSHGYNVSAEVFGHFEKRGEFFCFAGQSNQAVTGIFNLYRASQVMFPGEIILEKAKQFAFRFLSEKQAANELLDKWIIMKDLPGEVGFALKVPWHASLPRVETRYYIDQYGGQNDVWIGKTLYRMPYVNNNVYLELAKLDFNKCQALHKLEWDSMQKWFTENNFGQFGMSRKTLLGKYFLAVSSIFEPEKSLERVAWAKTAFMVEVIGTYFEEEMNSEEHRRAFVQQYKKMNLSRSHINGRRTTKQNLISILQTTLNHLALDALVAYGRDISSSLRHSWEKWMTRWEEEGDRYKGAAELMVKTISLSSGQLFLDNSMSHPTYQKLINLTNTICRHLGRYQTQKGHDNGNYILDSDGIIDVKVERDMQELVQLVLRNSSVDVDKGVKETFFTVARSFYYGAYFDLGTINSHIAKVLFERVD